MRTVKEVGNRWQGEALNPTPSQEATYQNHSPILTDPYDLTYHAKQLGKGLLVFGAGLLGYVGFNAFFGSRREASTLEAERTVNGNLVLLEENLLGIQATISGMSTSLAHQEPNKFEPTPFSTSRTLLSSQEKEGRQTSGVGAVRDRDSVEADKETPTFESTRRSILEIGYQGGTEFQVNTYTINYQYYSVVTAFPAGGFVVVWSGEGATDFSGVYGQRYKATGLPEGTEFQVNTYTTSSQLSPAVAAFLTGGFVVVWTSYGQDGGGGSLPYGIYGQRYNAAGLPIGAEFQVNSYTTLNQDNPAVSALTTGGFVVVWHSADQDGSGGGVYGQRYNASGLSMGPEFQINTYTSSNQWFPAVAALSAAGFVVVWHSNGQDGNGNGVYGQRYNASGLPNGPEFQVNTNTVASQWYPAVTAFPTGGFVVVWQSLEQDGSFDEIYGQCYNASGLPEGPEFHVNTYTTSDQRYPKVTALSAGGFVVVWQSNGQDSEGYGVYGQRYNTKGYRVGEEFQVNTYTTNDQRDPAVSTSEGGFLVVWQSFGGQDGSFSGVYGRIFSSHTAPVLLKNTLMIAQGGTTQITSSMLLAMDRETSNGTLLFTVRNTTFGQFENVNMPGSALETFKQQDVMDDFIRFVHGGTINKPYYEIKVSDGEISDGSLGTAYVPANIIFYLKENSTTPANPGWVIPVIITSSLLGVACLCISAFSVFVITAGGIYIAKSKKYRKSMHDIELETLEGTVTLSPFMHEFNIDSSEIHLKEKIGQGGEASVYLAKWSNKTVAYKVTNIIDPSAINEFEKEAEIMLKSNHPNIVSVYRICVTPKRIGLVMEFMALGSLKAAIKKKSIRLTWDTIWNIAYDLATVTAFLHNKDIVHRDIKTDNLLLYQEDGEIHAKLADFGLSKGKQMDDASVTMGIGTYKYLAPEMVLGDGHHSERAVDIYAIGMTFVALINEEEPYPNITNAVSIPATVGNGQYWQKLAKKNYDPAFFKLTNLCRSIDPAERPTAKQIVKQLKEIEEEPLDILEENENLNQELSTPSALVDNPSSEELSIAVTGAPATYDLFPVQQAEKRKSLDEFKDILGRQKEKLKNGGFNSNNFEAMKAEFQELERLVSDMQSSVGKQEKKEDTVSALNKSTDAPSEPITFENRISM